MSHTQATTGWSSTTNDLVKFLACPHITTQDEVAKIFPRVADQVPQEDGLLLAFERGGGYRDRYLAQLAEQGVTPVVIAAGPHSVEQTQQAMSQEVAVIADAVLAGAGESDFTVDFLVRAGKGYEPVEASLARRHEVAALLQVAEAADRLDALQGQPPERLILVNVAGAPTFWPTSEVTAFARRARARWRAHQTAVAAAAGVKQLPTQPLPCAACGQCRWFSQCSDEWRSTDDLVQLSAVRPWHRSALHHAGITTIAALADARKLPGVIPARVREKLTTHARLMVQERRQGSPSYELLDPVAGQGLLSLPEPDAGDLYLDFEGDPYVEREPAPQDRLAEVLGDWRGLEYLAGVVDRPGDSGGDHYQPLWAHDAASEAHMVANLVDVLSERAAAYPGMHIYHYSPYETAVLRRLSSRYETRQAKLQLLLDSGRFVDLYPVVKNGVRVGAGSYSLKKLEPLFWPTGRAGDVVASGVASIVAYEKWLAARALEGESAAAPVLEAIASYNATDVRSTRALHDWLEQRRAELEQHHGQQPRPRRSETDVNPTPAAAVQAPLHEESKPRPASVPPSLPEELAQARAAAKHLVWMPVRPSPTQSYANVMQQTITGQVTVAVKLEGCRLDEVLVVPATRFLGARLAKELPAGCRVSMRVASPADAASPVDSPYAVVVYVWEDPGGGPAIESRVPLPHHERLAQLMTVTRHRVVVVGDGRAADALPESLPQLRQANALCQFIAAAEGEHPDSHGSSTPEQQPAPTSIPDVDPTEATGSAATPAWADALTQWAAKYRG